jgi:hypothetical protein
MIVIDVNLISAVSRTRDCKLGTMVICNVATSQCGNYGDYKVDVYKKGTKDFREAKPFRSGRVFNHPRKREPIWKLLAKALEAAGYETI